MHATCGFKDLVDDLFVSFGVYSSSKYVLAASKNSCTGEIT